MRTFNYFCVGYAFDNGFCADIVDDDKQYSAWIYHKDYGIKLFMFAVDNPRETLESFTELVKSSFENYVEQYKEDYMMD